MKIWLLIAALLAAALPQRVPTRMPSFEWMYEGHWQTSIAEGGRTSRLFLVISPLGRPVATLVSAPGMRPQPANGYTSSADGLIQLRFPNPSIEIHARMRPAGDALDATVVRGRTEHPAVFTRVAPALPSRRPQTPRPPYPYDVVNLSIDTGSGVLAATLTIPRGAGPFPGAVLLSGTGPDDRDASYGGHRPFFVIADHLTRNGFAVLRFDDRGAGQSSGLFGELRTVEADALDAIAVLRHLRSERGVDPARTGFIGFSEGGAVAPEAQRNGAGAAFMVLLGAPALDAVSLMLLQKDRIARSLGIPEARIQKDIALNAAVAEIVRGGLAPAEATAALKTALETSARDAGVTIVDQAAFARALDAALARMALPVFRQRLTFDPVPALREARIPALALYGARDVVVPAPENAPAMRRALGGSSPLSDVLVLDGLNHGFQTANTGSVAEAAQIEETFAPRALEVITAWLRRATAK